MPELPEVEVLVRHLDERLRGRVIQRVEVLRPRAVRPGDGRGFAWALEGVSVLGVRRRAKYLVVDLAGPRRSVGAVLVGHLGMTGRMTVREAGSQRSKHAAVVFGLGDEEWVFEDPRGFGRMTVEPSVLEGLGPEPLDAGFTPDVLAEALGRSRQAVKVRLLDQSVVAGLGNIYAVEALFRARVSPRRRAGALRPPEIARLRDAIREVLDEAIRFGTSVALDFSGAGSGDGLFYHGSEAGAEGRYEERLRVYDRAGLPCVVCGTPIRKGTQAARSTYHCPSCQR